MPRNLSELDKLTEEAIAQIGGIDIFSVQEAEDFVNLLIYADSGTGKTVLAGSSDAVPEMSPVLFVDGEGGTFSLRAFYPNCKVVRVKSWREMQELYNALRRGDHPYKTIVLDSLTEFQKFSMNEIMREVVEKDPDRDPEVPSVREWGKSGEQIRRLVRGFRDLPMNVIFTALVLDDKNQKTGKTVYRPSLPGKLAKEIPGYVDLCLYMYKKDIPNPNEEGKTLNARLLLSSATEEYVCKDRSNNLPPVLVEPTMRDIYDAVHGKQITNNQDTGAEDNGISS
jgi:hypothetical protein